MKTPIYDFVQNYAKAQGTRFHMPGHKGTAFLGCEPYDITEVAGADVLSEAAGIIGESQANAAALFRTGASFYSTEGSSQSIKAMLGAALMYWRSRQSAGSQARPWVLAARNVHRAMIDGCALLDLDVRFLPTGGQNSLCSVHTDAGAVESALTGAQGSPIGVYLTSPDYLGGQSDIKAVAEVCHAHGIPLLVDNAHGAYLAFLEPSMHPIALGADLCCDSAHKTLPVLTGGGYLHLHPACTEQFRDYIPQCMTLFGSTSPSYLILQSLDLCNNYLERDYKYRLKSCIIRIDRLIETMADRGIVIRKSDPLRIVIDTGAAGYTGEQISREMREREQIECEFCDLQYVVLMLTPENNERDLDRLDAWSRFTVLRTPVESHFRQNVVFTETADRSMTIREAVFAPSETIPVTEAQGRILAQETVSCPPAIPIGISGELVEKEMIKMFQLYGIDTIRVVKQA